MVETLFEKSQANTRLTSNRPYTCPTHEPSPWLREESRQSARTPITQLKLMTDFGTDFLPAEEHSSFF